MCETECVKDKLRWNLFFNFRYNCNYNYNCDCPIGRSTEVVVEERVIEKNYIILICNMTNNGITMNIMLVAYVGIQKCFANIRRRWSKTDCDIHPL